MDKPFPSTDATFLPWLDTLDAEEATSICQEFQIQEMERSITSGNSPNRTAIQDL